jgi:serine/threonine protein kinase
VYEGTDTRLDRKVAVKILTGRLFGDSGALRRFAREARASALLDHPNIVRIHDYGEIAGEGAYLVQEFVAGVPLSSAYPAFARDPKSAAAVMDQVLAGMEAAHAAHVIHRDLKPGNILVSRRGEGDAYNVKIIDFGLAKVRQLEFSDPKSGTEPGMAMGTLGYMSMEQSLGLEVDARADIYSLGVIALELVTGRLERYGYAMQLTASGLLEERLGFAGAGEARRALKEVLARCLALEADARFQSVADMRRELVPALMACPPRGHGARCHDLRRRGSGRRARRGQ